MADYPRVAGASVVAFLLDSEKILFSFRTFAKEEKSRATEKDDYLIQEFCLYKQAISRPFDAPHALQAADLEIRSSYS